MYINVRVELNQHTAYLKLQWTKAFNKKKGEGSISFFMLYPLEGKIWFLPQNFSLTPSAFFQRKNSRHKFDPQMPDISLAVLATHC